MYVYSTHHIGRHAEVAQIRSDELKSDLVTKPTIKYCLIGYFVKALYNVIGEQCFRMSESSEYNILDRSIIVFSEVQTKNYNL